MGFIDDVTHDSRTVFIHHKQLIPILRRKLYIVLPFLTQCYKSGHLVKTPIHITRVIPKTSLVLCPPRIHAILNKNAPCTSIDKASNLQWRGSTHLYQSFDTDLCAC